MKKIIPILLLVGLLSGCTSQKPDPTQTSTPPVTTEATVPTKTVPAPAGDLLAGRVAVPGSPNLYEISCPAVADMTLESLYVYQDCLLLVQVTYPEDFCCGQITEPVPIRMVLIDQQTGLERAHADLEIEGFPKFQIAGDYISVQEWEKGQVLLFDGELNQLGSYTLSPSWALTAVDHSGTYAYIIPETGMLTQVELATGNQVPMTEALPNLASNGVTPGGAVLGYADADGNRSQYLYLDLKENTLTPVPFTGNFTNAECVDGLWLMNLQDKPDTCLLGRDADPYVLSTPNTYYHLIDGPAPLYTASGDETVTNLMAYREDGSFYSAAHCPTTVGYVTDPQWSEARQGYFLFARTPEGPSQLLFWDPAVPSEGTALALSRLGSNENP